jgi:hypothetical protein
MASRLAIAMLGSLLVAAMSMLMFANAALAHAPSPRDHENPSHYLGLSAESEAIKPTAPSEYAHKAIVIVPVPALIAQLQPRTLDSTPARNGSDEIEFDDDCCGAACHATLGSISCDSGQRRRPLSVVIVAGSSDLPGRSQGPPERPPRRIA